MECTVGNQIFIRYYSYFRLIPNCELLLMESQNGPSHSQPPGVVSTMPVAKESSPTQLPPVSTPNDETDEETRQRLNDETEAKHRSDRQLEHQRRKILLLGSYHLSTSCVSNLHLCLAISITVGQAESGKSTVLKNFRLKFTPKAFESEVRLTPLLKALF